MFQSLQGRFGMLDQLFEHVQGRTLRFVEEIIAFIRLIELVDDLTAVFHELPVVHARL